MRYGFLDFVFDTDRYELLRGGEIVRLRPKALDLLRYLLERPGKVAGKEELMSVLWPDLNVGEDSLTQCVAELRRALGPRGEGLIRTVSKRGYMLESHVRTSPLTVHQLRLGPSHLRVPLVAFALGAVVALGASTFLAASRAAPMPGPLFEGSRTVLGQEFSYPDGTPTIRAGVKILPQGARSPWHEHSTPVFAYILRGEVTVDYGARGMHVLSEGSGAIEAIDWLHQARNDGAEPAEILVIELDASRSGLSDQTALGGSSD